MLCFLLNEGVVFSSEIQEKKFHPPGFLDFTSSTPRAQLSKNRGSTLKISGDGESGLLCPCPKQRKNHPRNMNPLILEETQPGTRIPFKNKKSKTKKKKKF